MEDFTVVKKLGSGGQGTTHSVVRKADRQTFVIKQVCLHEDGEREGEAGRGRGMREQEMQRGCRRMRGRKTEKGKSGSSENAGPFRKEGMISRRERREKFVGRNLERTTSFICSHNIFRAGRPVDHAALKCENVFLTSTMHADRLATCTCRSYVQT